MPQGRSQPRYVEKPSWRVRRRSCPPHVMLQTCPPGAEIDDPLSTMNASAEFDRIDLGGGGDRSIAVAPAVLIGPICA